MFVSSENRVNVLLVFGGLLGPSNTGPLTVALCLGPPFATRAWGPGGIGKGPSPFVTAGVPLAL